MYFCVSHHMNTTQPPIHHHHESQDKATKVSMFLSLLCTIHCILTPILLVFLGIYPSINATFQILNHPLVEIFIILFSAILGLYTMRHGFKFHHHVSRPIYLFSFGICLFILHFTLHFVGFNEAINLVISLVGSLLILWSQVLNYRLMNRTKCAD